MKPAHPLGKAYWCCAAFTLLSALVSATFSLLSLRMAGGHEYALYAASRSIALPVAVLCALARRSRGGMAALALAMTLIQLLDGFIGFHLQDPSRSYGPIGFAAINFLLLVWMNRAPRTAALPSN
jgi:hypothetical protein